MDQRIPEALTGITILLIGLFMTISNIIDFLSIDPEMASSIARPLSLLVFVFSILTASVLIKDAMKKEDED